MSSLFPSERVTQFPHTAHSPFWVSAFWEFSISQQKHYYKTSGWTVEGTELKKKIISCFLSLTMAIPKSHGNQKETRRQKWRLNSRMCCSQSRTSATFSWCAGLLDKGTCRNWHPAFPLFSMEVLSWRREPPLCVLNPISVCANTCTKCLWQSLLVKEVLGRRKSIKGWLQRC